MLHRITGRALKCGPCAISAIAGVPTHEAAAVIRRLFDRRAVNGIFTDELAAALEAFGWAPDYAIRHPNYRERRHSRRECRMGAPLRRRPLPRPRHDPRDLPGRAPSGTWAVSASNHFVAYADGFVADSGAWFSRRPARWSRADPGHDRVALRRVREAVRFVRVSPENARRDPRTEEC